MVSGVGWRNDNKAVKQRLAPQENACKLLMRSLEGQAGLGRVRPGNKERRLREVGKKR